MKLWWCIFPVVVFMYIVNTQNQNVYKSFVSLFGLLNHVWVVSLCIWSHCDGFVFNSFFVSFIHLVICMVTFPLFFLLLKSFFNHHQVKTIEAQSSSSFVSSKFPVVRFFFSYFIFGHDDDLSCEIIHWIMQDSRKFKRFNSYRSIRLHKILGL